MDPEDIVELFRDFGPVTVRRMFGGAGIFAEGMSIAIVADGVIYLKADAQNTPDFERERLAPFTYARNDGEKAVMSYRRMPDRCYDEPDEAAQWARGALAAARRAKVPKKKPAATKPALKTSAKKKKAR